MRDYAELIHDLRCCSDVGTCNSCSREKDSNMERCDSIEREAADAIEELLDELTTIRKQLPHWISVEERLPEKYESVITANKNGDVRWNYLINAKYGTWSNGYHITHWMPFPKAPEPPKGVE